MKLVELTLDPNVQVNHFCLEEGERFQPVYQESVGDLSVELSSHGEPEDSLGSVGGNYCYGCCTESWPD